jgi:hypothetical protein
MESEDDCFDQEPLSNKEPVADMVDEDSDDSDYGTTWEQLNDANKDTDDEQPIAAVVKSKPKPKKAVTIVESAETNPKKRKPQDINWGPNDSSLTVKDTENRVKFAIKTAVTFRQGDGSTVKLAKDTFFQSTGPVMGKGRIWRVEDIFMDYHGGRNGGIRVQEYFYQRSTNQRKTLYRTNNWLKVLKSQGLVDVVNAIVKVSTPDNPIVDSPYIWKGHYATLTVDEHGRRKIDKTCEEKNLSGFGKKIAVEMCDMPRSMRCEMERLKDSAEVVRAVAVAKSKGKKKPVQPPPSLNRGDESEEEDWIDMAPKKLSKRPKSDSISDNNDGLMKIARGFALMLEGHAIISKK